MATMMEKFGKHADHKLQKVSGTTTINKLISDEEWEQVINQARNHPGEVRSWSCRPEFYRLESLDYLSRNTASDYVTKARSRIEEERVRSGALGLPPTTEAPLQNIVETELIERHARTLVSIENSGFAALLRDETKVDELTRMYDLFVRVPGSVDHLRDALGDRVKSWCRTMADASLCCVALALRRGAQGTGTERAGRGSSSFLDGSLVKF